MNISVAIVDDNFGAREGLAALVRMSPGHHLVSACKSGQGALVELPLTLPSVVLLENNLRDLSGPECIRRLRQLIPRVEILVLTSRMEVPQVFEAMAAGAHGYLLKDTSPARVLEAISEISNGGSPMTPSVARCLVNRLYDERPGAAERVRLSPREEQVLWEFRRGSRTKEAAAALNISSYTVQTHVRNIYSKLGVRSLAEAVACYFGTQWQASTTNNA